MTALGDFSAGDVLTAADLNAIGTWTSFTPSWSNLTVGNGTYDWAEYCQINELVFVRVNLSLGITSSVGTGPSFTVPVATSEGTQLTTGYGRGGAFSGNFYWLTPYMISNQITLYCTNASSSYAYRNAVTATVPGIWSSTSSIQIEAMYRT